MDTNSILMTLLTFGLPVLIAITFHEAAHGFVALRCGDTTALSQGRVTLNPLKHIDPVGTVLIPAILIFIKAPFLFGYAKPVPVNFGALNNPRRDMILVAGAGPAMNFILAFVSALLIHCLDLFPADMAPIIAKILNISIYINVLLGVFNLIPLPPLDGGRIAVGLLPPILARPLARLEPYGFFIILFALFGIPYIAKALGHEFSLFSLLLKGPIQYIMNIITTLAGLQ